jgi:diguanylate cyclase (GGDEF)-like protein
MSSNRSVFSLDTEQLPQRIALLLLGTAAFAAGSSGLLHHLRGDANLLDRWVPPLLALFFFAQLIWVWRHPTRIELALQLGLAVGVLGLALPSIWYVRQALVPGAAPLVETLPPLPTTLIPLTLAMTIFLRPRAALWSAFGAWLAIGAPVLLYLLLHPQELLSPRGREIAMLLGPVMLMVLAYVPFHRGVQMRMEALSSERARMQALAERDALTGLYNRRAAEAHLNSLRRDPSSMDLILFDIDNFKTINDSHGHPVGDVVLREIANRCQSRLGENGVLARWGGEEFLVLAPGSADASVAEDLRWVIAASGIASVGRVTASFGCTRLRRDETAAEALQRADEALYAAKAAGRNRVETR